MLNTWRMMWSNEDRGDPEPWTPRVMAAVAIVAIFFGSMMSFGYI